jgi:hypothetical protein
MTQAGKNEFLIQWVSYFWFRFVEIILDLKQWWICMRFSILISCLFISFSQDLATNSEITKCFCQKMWGSFWSGQSSFNFQSIMESNRFLHTYFFFNFSLYFLIDREIEKHLRESVLTKQHLMPKWKHIQNQSHCIYVPRWAKYISDGLISNLWHSKNKGKPTSFLLYFKI